MGGGGGEPTYVSNDYQETMREALQAQIDLAPDLFYAESDQTYGRPAYARMQQDLVQEGLFGQRVNVDDQGYTTEFNYGATPENGFVIENEDQMYDRYLADNPDVAKAITTGKDPDGSRADWTRDKTAREAAKYHADKFAVADGRTLYEAGIYDAEGNSVKGATTKKYVGGPAGERREGGAVDTIAGTQEFAFSDGTTRRSGFDESGEFMGTSALEQDILEKAKDQQTRAEIAMANEYGGQLTTAYRNQGGIKTALDDFNALGEKNSDHGGLRSTLTQQALSDLQLGGQLSDEERRQVEQDSRMAMGARGRGRDFSGVVDEVASNEAMRRQRETERRMFASQALGLADAGLAQDRAFAAQRVGIEQATSADPFMAITGRASGASVASGQNLYGNAAAGISAGPTLYNPSQGASFIAQQTAGLNNFNANVYASNQAASAGMFGGAMGALGTLGGAAILAGCWVAREVYGVHNPRWLMFRYWMLNTSPVWFRFTYLKFGKQFAWLIRNKPKIKSKIRKWMDCKIREVV